MSVSTTLSKKEGGKKNMNTTNFFAQREAIQINEALANLPRAELLKIETEQGEKINNFRTVKVINNNGKTFFVNCPTNRYTLVQHEDAFRPIIEGLTQAGVSNFKFSCYSDENRAKLNIFVGSAGFDSVSLGIQVYNSYDGTSAVHFGFDLNRRKQYLEVVGYRQVCSNGMKIRVPLNEAEIIKLETVEKIESLLHERTSLRHTESVVDKLEAIQYTTEALALLREPVENEIKKAMLFTIENRKKLKELVLKHVGKRYAERVERQYDRDNGKSLWDLFNAVTYVASHNDGINKVISRDNLIDKASVLLYKELHAPQVSQEV
jgi:hypothetical protein